MTTNKALEAARDYRKKPVVIQAVQWTGENYDEIAALSTVNRGSIRRKDRALPIRTLEGEMLANVGDWVIRGVKGEIYPCKPDIFAATYEPAAIESALSAPTGGVTVEWRTRKDSVQEAFAGGINIGFVVGVGIHWRWIFDTFRSIRIEEGNASSEAEARAAFEASFRATLSRLTGGVLAVPEGWKLVPIKPTPEIKRAIIEAVTVKYEGACETYAAMLSAAPTVAGGEGASWSLVEHLRHQREWSRQTFGPGARTAGVVDHIRKELSEIEADPSDIAEWVDVIILGFDGAWRAGWEPEDIVAAIRAKQAKNEARVWPDWRTMSPDHAIEHDRSHDAETPSPLPPLTKGGE